jgi:hypothetical protein
MFARDGLPNRRTKIDVPLLVLTGEHDAEPMREASMRASLSRCGRSSSAAPCPTAATIQCKEAQPLGVTVIECFVIGAREGRGVRGAA